ncbi:putative amyloid binding protein [Schistosoma mansoni]|nr:putative amyloid binding protein [Schistosoma mansoni]|eukprot:XP_018650079.1 putative amyloid binding protein [Schistosoma mansoni]
MFQDNNSSPLICLSKIVLSSIPSGWKVTSQLNNCFKLFSNILPFSSPLELEYFFQFNHFANKGEIKTIYGTFAYYEISNKLKQLMFRKELSLSNSCLLSLIENPPPNFTTHCLLGLPSALFQQFIIISFCIYWLPMTHVLYHRTVPEEGNSGALQTVFSFLADPHVFNKLYETCRDVQVFVYSWMQHSHFYGVSGANTEVNQYINIVFKHSDYSPLVEPHALSNNLVLNLHEVLTRAPRLKRNAAPEVIAAALLGLKVSNFLCECSEYVHACKAARSVHETVRSFFTLTKFHRAQQRLEYDAMCIMLRAMNAHNMYLEPEDQQVFHHEAPSLLKSMWKSRLLMTKSMNKNNFEYSLLPVSLENTSQNAFVSIGLSASRSSDEISEGISSPSISIVGPAGDESPCVLETPTTRPASLISDSYFPTVYSTSEVVLNLLDGNLDICLSTSAYMSAQLATYHYSMCHYQIAFHFTVLAIEQLEICFNQGTPPSPHVTVEVLRIMCKVCIIKRKYSLGLRIIKHALMYTRSVYGYRNLIYANLLIEYGCLMLNTDKTHKAAEIYRIALALILNYLPGASIMVALALEAIAYAHYVLEYTSGDFAYALNCAEIAGLMLRRLNYGVCMQAASANRVKALIIEEIAIDDNDPSRTRSDLKLARDLHMESLELCERTYGLWNIQTAKHFGNLGRLYQSMQNNKEAEIMHLRAIEIKERLLGPTDFEVGLSVGHLASLYNYDMDRFKEAEQLYLRSVQISLNLFGPTYSGLEYDYRGLQRVYHELGNYSEMQRYQGLFDYWSKERQRLRSLEPCESSDSLEFSDENNIIGLTEQSQLLMELLKEYKYQFKSIFESLHVDYNNENMVNTATTTQDTLNMNFGGSSTMEASRSTGY